MAFPTEPTDSIGNPISTGYVPAPNANFIAVQSSPFVSTDTSSNNSTAAVVLPAPSTHGLPFVAPCITQKTSGVTGSGAKTLAIAFVNNNITGNSLVVVMGMGEVEAAGITLAITDTLGNTYTQAVKGSQSTTQEAAIFYATTILPGANTVTITISGGSSSNTAIAAEIYEVQGFITVSSLVVDQSNSSSNAGSTVVSTANITPNYANSLSFMGVAAAGGTITAGAGWIQDSGLTALAPTGGNLVSFAAESHFQMSVGPLIPTATLGTSNAWAVCTVCFRAMHIQQEGTHTVQGGFLELGGLSAGSLNADLVPSTDVSAYQFLSLHINASVYSGTLTPAFSNDNVNWISCNMYPSSDDGTNASFFFSQSSALSFTWRKGRYFRIRMTSYTSGIGQGTLELYTQSPPFALEKIVAQVSSVTISSSSVYLFEPLGTIFASAAYTATQTQADQGNANARGVRVILDMTSAGTGSVTLEIDVKDAPSGKYVALLTGAAVTSNSTNVYVVYPGLISSANAIASDVLPYKWRIKVVANNANSMTYSVGASYLL